MDNYTKERFKIANDNLPNKLSELLEVAINDLKLAIDDEDYWVDMSTWHMPEYDIDQDNEDERYIQYCVVCLAGSALAFTGQLPMDIDYDKEKENLTNEFSTLDTKLELLNYFNNGGLYDIIQYYERRLLKQKFDSEKALKVSDRVRLETEYWKYAQDRNKYIKYLEDTLKILKEEGY